MIDCQQIKYEVEVLSEDRNNEFTIQSVLDFEIRDSRYKHVAIHVRSNNKKFPDIVTTGHNSNGNPIVSLVNGNHIVDITFDLSNGCWIVLMYETIGNLVHLLLVNVDQVSGV